MKAPPTSARWIVLAALCAAATIAYVGRTCLGLVQQPIREELGIKLVPMGWVMGMFFWSYAFAQIPAAWLGHVWGSRAALAFYAAAWSLACAAMGLANGFWALIIAQLCFGTAQAGLFPCAGAIIAKWASISRRAVSSGLLGGFQSVGGALGSAMTGALLAGVLFDYEFPAMHWRWIYALYALPGLVWAAWFFYWFRDQAVDHGGVNEAELALLPHEEEESASTHSPAWWRIALRFDLWMIYGQQFMRAAGYIFFATWFPEFLQQTRGVTLEEAGLLTALPLLAVVVGAPTGGVIVDFLWNRTHSRRLSRQVVAVAAMSACAGCIALAYFVDDAMLAVLVIAAGAFCAALGGPAGYTVTIDKSGPAVAPIFGAMNMFGNLGAAICPVVVAWIAQTTGDWNVVLIFFALIYVGAAVFWMLLNPEIDHE